jgi:hypothetical protein
MRRITNHKNLAVRLAVASIAITLSALACADLKFNVSVQASGKQSPGSPQSGQFVVAFRSNLARLEQPDGTVRLFDFASSKVAVLDPATRTYTIVSMGDALASGQKTSQTATLSADTTVKAGKSFGVTTQKLLIASASDQAAKTHQSEASKNADAGSSSKDGISEAFAWVADGTAVKSNIGSVAPLVLIGAPRALAYAIAQSLDQQTAIPVWMSFSWTNGAKLEMTVDSIDAAALPDATFAIPAKYKLVSPVGVS